MKLTREEQDAFDEMLRYLEAASYALVALLEETRISDHLKREELVTLENAAELLEQKEAAL